MNVEKESTGGISAPKTTMNIVYVYPVLWAFCIQIEQEDPELNPSETNPPTPSLRAPSSYLTEVQQRPP